MKKINQGKYEVFTTKQDAIDKFMQMQGICREKISSENPIEFYCSKKGKIVITNPPTRRVTGENSTNLFAEVVEQDNKTYITFYTEFSKSNNILKLIFLTISIIAAIFSIMFAIINVDKMASLIVLFLCLVLFVFQLFTTAKEKNNSPKDSEILIKELEKRVDAVNLWDK